MSDSPVLHVQREQKVNLFWRGATVVGLVFIAAGLLLVLISLSVLVRAAEMGPAAERTAMAGLGVTLVSATLLWIPYLLLKRSVAPTGSASGQEPPTGQPDSP